MFKKVISEHTIQGNEIFLLESQNDKFDKTVLIIGVFHGEEPQGEYLINRFLKTDLMNLKNKLLIIPCLNPDGKIKNQRQNSNLVDLNRNFPTKNWKRTEKNDYYGGEFSASEIETKFIINVLDNYRIDAILSIHAPFKIVNYDGPAKNLANKISSLTGYKVQREIGYPTLGSFGTYAGVERNIPTITLELPENETDESLWAVNKSVFSYFAYEF